MEYINLSNNSIDDKAIILLAKFGKNIKNISRINLENNKITESKSKKSIFMEKLKKEGVKIRLIL